MTKNIEPEHVYCSPRGGTAIWRWMITFDDASLSYSLYEDEISAREAFEDAENRGWNCYLWELATRSPLG